MDLETIYRLYFRDVYRYVRALSQNEHLAEEIAQETFTRALGAVDRFDGRGDVRAWLFTIAKNAWVDHCRRHRRETELPGEDLARGTCQYVVQFQLESGDPLRGRTERFVETDEDGTVTRAGLVVDLWEVLPVTSGSGNYGTGFTESVGTVSEDFDFVCIVRYRDGAVTYSAREMGLLDPAG